MTGGPSRSAEVVITNGIGYDPVADRVLLPTRRRVGQVVDVGDLVCLREGANPHQRSSPTSVAKVIAAITEAYRRADLSHAADYDAQRQIDDGLATYRAAIEDTSVVMRRADRRIGRACSHRWPRRSGSE